MSLAEKSRKQFLDRKKDKNKIGNYIMGTTIEDNVFIKIRMGKNLTTNENVIIKIIDKSYLYENENNLNNLTAEISILKILHHKNVIRLYELREMATNLYVIIEYCENNSLFEYVKNYDNKFKFIQNNNNNNDNNYQSNSSSNNVKNEKSRNNKIEAYLASENSYPKSESSDLIKLNNSKRNFNNIANTINNSSNYNSENKNNNLNVSANSANNSAPTPNTKIKPTPSVINGLPEIEACRLFQDLIDGLEYLHSQNICVRDLNPQNIFLDYKFNLKIANFSFAKIYQNDKLLKTPIGMLQFTAPEVLLGKGYHGLFSDIWSSGVTLYFMLTGSFPFHDESDEASLKKMYENKIDFPSSVSAQAQDLILNMLNKNCLERFDLNQIKSHPWFNLTKPNLNKGININFVSIPVDEKIVLKLENLEFDGETVRNKIVDNMHDESTAVYYLFLKNQIKGGYKSIADLESQLFIDYLNNPRNFTKNIELIKKEKELLEEESEYLRNIYEYCGHTNEKEDGETGVKKRSSLLIEEELEIQNADVFDYLDTEIEEDNQEESKLINKKIGFKHSNSLTKENQAKHSKNPLMKTLTGKINSDNPLKFKKSTSNEWNSEFENELNLNGLDLEFTEENRDKDKDDIDYCKGLLYNIEEIGNDFDQPDEDLINLINSSNKAKNEKKEKSPDKMRKSSILTKYSAEPIKEESVIDYVRPRRNSYLLFLDRNDVYGKLSYNKKERESLFKDIASDNHYDSTYSKDHKSVIENFKYRGKSINLLGKSQAEKDDKEEVISKANKNMLFNFFKMKIQEIINEDEDHDVNFEEKNKKKNKELNRDPKEKSLKKDKDKHKEKEKDKNNNNKKNFKDLKSEIKNKEKELLNNKLQLLKSSNIRERIRHYSKETTNKRNILNKLSSGEGEAIVENLYSSYSDESNSYFSGGEEKAKKEIKVFKPRKILKEQDPKEKQKQLKIKAKEFSKKVKINEEQKLKSKLNKKDSFLSTIESGFSDDKQDVRKINKYSRSDKNKDFVKLLEKYINMENGPINMERIEKILKDLYEQNQIRNYGEFYKEIKDINEKIKTINDDGHLKVKMITEANEEHVNENKKPIKDKQKRTSSLPRSMNSNCNYEYLLKDLSHRDAKTPKYRPVVSKENENCAKKNLELIKNKVSDMGNYYQKTSFSVEKTDGQEEEDDIGVFIDENFIGKLKDNIKKTLKETDHIIMESGKVKKDIIKSNHLNSMIKPKCASTSVNSTKLKNFKSSKKINVNRHKLNSLEKIDLNKTFKYKYLMTDNCGTERNFKTKRRLSIDTIGDKLLNTYSNVKLLESNKEDMKFKTLLDEENISPVNNARNINRFKYLNKELNQDNPINREYNTQVIHLTDNDLSDPLRNCRPVIKIIKANNLENEKENSKLVNKEIKNKPNQALSKENKDSLIDSETKVTSNYLNTVNELVSYPYKTNKNGKLQKKSLVTKKDSQSNKLENNSQNTSNILKTETNDILNYKNLLENLGVYPGNKDKKNKKDHPIVNNTNISITIKKKNYYFENKIDPKGKSILKKIELVKEDSANKNQIDIQGKQSESTLDSFNFQEMINLKSNNSPIFNRKNFNLYTTSIKNSQKELNKDFTAEKNFYLTEVSNADSFKTTINELFKNDAINLIDSRDSGFSINNNPDSKDPIDIKEKLNYQNNLPNRNEDNQKDLKKITLNKNRTANLICQNNIEDKNKIKLNLKTGASVKKPAVSVKNNKNEFNLNNKEKCKIIKVDKQSIHTIIMNYLAESKTCFLFKNEKFKITKNTFNYEIELTKRVSNPGEIKSLNPSTSSYYVKFVFTKGNWSNYTEEVSKIQSLLME